jgi:hypothetical protein
VVDIWAGPITVDALSKAWTVFALSNTGSWVRIPLEAWMSLGVFCVYVVLCIGRSLATGWSPVQGILPCIGLGDLKAAKAEQRTVEPQIGRCLGVYCSVPMAWMFGAYLFIRSDNWLLIR